MRISHLVLFTSTFLAAPLTYAQQSADTSAREALAVTVYNSNLGVVRDVRRINITKGGSEIRLRDVPTQIDPTTVKITARDHAGNVEVVEQNYEYDLVSQQKLLEKYIDKTITVVDDKGVSTSGTLLSTEGDKLTLSTSNGIVMLPNLARYTIQVPQLSAGLITKPTLIWQLNADRSLSNEPVEVLYQTGGMSWHTEYIAALNENDNALDLTGWVSVENTSGASYPDAKLKLVAGDLHRATPPQPVPMMRNQYAADEVMSKQQFEERGMFEYHVYDLGRKATIMNNEVKQISLLEANGVTAEKRYTYRGGRNAEVSVQFQNAEKNHLGMPLPMGVVRVMKRDKDGTLEFVGEDRINHTPRDEKITLKVGDAFDIIGERNVTDQRNFGNSQQETREIVLRNHKDEKVTIDVEESVGGDWEIPSKSMDYEKRNANLIVFHVPVNAHGEAKVTYTIITRWR